MENKFRKAMKEGETIESQNMDELSDTYPEYDMSENIDDLKGNEMEDTEYYDSWDDLINQTFSIPMNGNWLIQMR